MQPQPSNPETSPSPPLAGAKAALLARVAAEKSPTRQVMRRWGWLALAMAVLFWGGVTYTLDVHVGSRPLWYVTLSGAVWAALAAVTTYWALGNRQMTGLHRNALLGILLGVPLTLAVLAALGPILPGVPASCPKDTSPVGEKCRDITLGAAAVPLLVAMWLRRRTFPVHRRLLGAALGVAAASWAGVAMLLSCSCSAPRHLLAGHVLPVIIMGLVGALFGHLFLDVRRA